MENKGRPSAAIMSAIGDGNAPTWLGQAKAMYRGDESLGFVASFAVITESRMYWERFDGPPMDLSRSQVEQGIVVHSLDFHDAVHLYQDDADAIHIMTQPFDGDDNRFTHTQSRVVDDSFLFYDEAAGVALQEAMKYSRETMASSFGNELLATLNRVPVAMWAICPLCGGRLLQKTEHAAACSLSGHYYSDPNTRPVVSIDPSNFGALIGDEPFEEMDELIIRDGQSWGGRTLVFQLPPPNGANSAARLSFDESTTAKAAKVRGTMTDT